MATAQLQPHEIEHALDAFAYGAGFRPGTPFYIVGEFNLTDGKGKSLYSDEAHLWCEPCADQLLALALPLLPSDERKDHFVCEADPSTGEDTPSRCMACGKPLDHVLTSAGVNYELNHYSTYPVTDISPAEAWGIARLVESEPENAEAIAVARAALDAVEARRFRQPKPKTKARRKSERSITP